MNRKSKVEVDERFLRIAIDIELTRYDLERLILRTPTGEARDALTAANICLLEALAYLRGQRRGQRDD